MKKRFCAGGVAAAAVSAAMIFSSAGMSLAEEPASAAEGMMTLIKEMNGQADFQVDETVVCSMDGIQMTISLRAAKGANCITDCNVVVQISIPEQDAIEVVIEDLFRVLPDACYVNVGEIFDIAAEFAGNNLAQQFAKMLGVSESWIRIPYGENEKSLIEQVTMLVNTMNTKLTEGISDFVTEETKGCYEITFDNESCISILERMLQVIEENSNEWIRLALDLAEEIDLEAAVGNYAEAAVRGIQFVDPSFDDSVVFEAIDMVNSEYHTWLEELNPEEITEEINNAFESEFGEEDAGFEEISDSLRKAMEENEMIIEGIWSLQKDGDNRYLISCNESIADSNSTSAVVSVIASVAPCDPVAAEVPESFMEAEELAEELAASIYALYYVYGIEMLDAFDSDSVYDQGDESDFDLLVDGNRFYMEDYDGLVSCWVTYDDTALSLDMDFSHSQNVYYNMTDPDNYNYIYLLIENGMSFQEECEMNTSMYDDFYESYTVSEVQVSNAGEVPIQYVLIDCVTEDGYEISKLWFGVDFTDTGCLFGQMDLEEDNLEAMISVMHQAIAGLETSETLWN